MLIIQIEDHTSVSNLIIYKGMLDSLIAIREKESGNESNAKRAAFDTAIAGAATVFTQSGVPQPPINLSQVPQGLIPQPPVSIGGPAASLAQLPPVASQPLVAGVEVDSKGDVWDGRIHAATRAKVADGTWRMKRGIDDATVAAVRAEHAKTQAAPTVSPGMFDRAAAGAAAVFGKPTPPPPPVSPLPNPPVSTGTIPNTATSLGEPPRLTFPELMRKITAGYAAQQIDKAAVDGALAQLGLPSLPMLATRPDLLHPMASLLGIAS